MAIIAGSVGGSSVEHLGPLSNVCYAVFALGSSAYPKYCNFGKTVDKLLYDLGGDRILDMENGDEMFGQEQQFRAWASNIFHVRIFFKTIDITYYEDYQDEKEN